MNWSTRFRAVGDGGFSFGNEVLPTLRLGSTGDDVKKWQTIVGVTADGSFGTLTQNATVKWQRAHKLAADGIVGPVSWSTALGTPTPIGKTSSAPTDQWAYEVAKRAEPTMPEEQIQYAVSVSRGEGFFGKGWGDDPNLGAGSNNWGAVQGTGSAGYFEHIDHHADGTEYTTKFKKYLTPEEGFKDMARILYSGGMRGAVGAKAIKDALKKGNLHDAVYAQHDNHYFELAPDKYLAAVVKNYNILKTNVDGWKTLLGENGLGVVRGVLKSVLGLAFGGILWYGYHRVNRG